MFIVRWHANRTCIQSRNHYSGGWCFVFLVLNDFLDLETFLLCCYSQCPNATARFAMESCCCALVVTSRIFPPLWSMENRRVSFPLDLCAFRFGGNAFHADLLRCRCFNAAFRVSWPSTSLPGFWCLTSLWGSWTLVLSSQRLELLVLSWYSWWFDISSVDLLIQCWTTPCGRRTEQFCIIFFLSTLSPGYLFLHLVHGDRRCYW